METSGGILSRLSEKVLGWVALALVALGAIAIYQMPAATKAAIWGGFWRSAAWTLIAAALPWFGKLFVRRLIQSGSNWASVAWLVGLSLADVIAGSSLMTAWPAGAWGWLAVAGLLALSATYNYLVSEYLAEMSGA